MKRAMPPMTRMALLTGLALQGAAFGLVAEDAHAGWNVTTLDGHSCTNSGCSSSAIVYGATAAMLDASGNATPLYTRATNGGAIYSGTDASFGTTCTDAFSISPVDNTAPDLNGPAVMFDNTNTWIAYTDTNGDLFAGFSSTGDPGAGTEILEPASCSPSQPLITGLPAIANFKVGTKGPFIFYEQDDQIFSQRWDTSTSNFQPTGTNVCGGGTSIAGSHSTIVRDPATAVFADGVPPNRVTRMWLFYHDTTDNCLRGKWTTDGVSWTLSTPVSGSNCIDGGGANVPDAVGQWPVTLVDDTNQRLWVFYFDSTSTKLRASYFNSGLATWGTPQNLDTVTIAPPSSGAPGKMIAAIMNKGTPQVYYIDSQNRALKYVSYNASTNSWDNPVTIDGTGCTATGCTPADQMDGPIAAVMRETCSPGTALQPHVFYQDFGTTVLGAEIKIQSLREGFYE